MFRTCTRVSESMSQRVSRMIEEVVASRHNVRVRVCDKVKNEYCISIATSTTVTVMWCLSLSLYRCVWWVHQAHEYTYHDAIVVAMSSLFWNCGVVNRNHRAIHCLLDVLEVDNQTDRNELEHDDQDQHELVANDVQVHLVHQSLALAHVLIDFNQLQHPEQVRLVGAPLCSVVVS
jgi:hypothetical protein